MKKKVIKIVDFSRYPSGRVRADGPSSGEKFREEYLLPALKDFDRVIIEIDGINGYPSSFTEEAFGGLVRDGQFSKSQILDKIVINNKSSIYDGYKEEMIEAMQQAEYRPHE